MPRLDTARHIASYQYNGAKTIGQIQKENADFLIEQVWDNDIQSKICYIYDYAHDDQPDVCKGMTYKNTTKTRIDAKFIVDSYGSIDKDQIAYKIMFRPSEKTSFSPTDELYYFETDYRKRYDVTFPIGLMIDVPDDKGIYTKWLIVDYEEANQFVKYSILPCDYRLQWVSIENGKSIKRQMWCCTRSANSYTSGLWIDRYINSLDDIQKVLLPLNNLTENIRHLKEDGTNQRLIISAKSTKPLTWKVSKVENTKPIGIVKLTMEEDSFNVRKDYVEHDDDGYIIGMWADYWQNPDVEPSTPDMTVTTTTRCELTASTSSIKDGGSYKTITAKYYSGNDEVTDTYRDENHLWSYLVGNEDVSDNITESVQADANIIKIKFKTDDRRYLGKALTVKCVSNNVIGTLQLQIIV